MNKEKVVLFTRLSIIGILLCGIAICFYFFPTYILSDISLNRNEKIILLTFYELLSLPCFYLLVTFWTITFKMIDDNQFSDNVAKTVKKDALILLSCSLILFLGNIIFSIININILTLFNIILSIIGFFLSVLLAIGSYYIKKAAFLKEETDGLI